MEMQLQGRFKRLPRGVLYLGGEITERLTLGLVAKSLANVLLKVKPTPLALLTLPTTRLTHSPTDSLTN